MKKLLEGITVLDLTRVLSGPYASMILADLGAEIIKVEMPQHGDEARKFGPFKNGESAYFASINRGKKSITIDIRKEKGQKLVQELAGKCDVLMENFRPGTMEKYNLGFEKLHQLYPQLIYVSISGFGQTGPYAQRPAYDVIIQAMSGLASITGPASGGPVRVGSSVADLNAALFGTIGILAALYDVRRTREGQHLDVSMLDSQIALLENAISRYTLSGKIPGPLGSRHPSITPFQFFKAADGYTVIAIGNDNLWKKFCDSIDHPSLADNDSFKTNDLRTLNHAELEKEITSIFQKKNVAEWCKILETDGIPCSPLYNVQEMMDDQQVKAREMIVKIPHPTAEYFIVPNSPLKFSKTPLNVKKASPFLGEHTTDVLKTFLQLPEEKIQQLKTDGVI